MEPIRLIEVKESILSDNTAAADALREKLKKTNTFLLNLMASPGAGKTSLILKTIDALKDRYELGVIEADIDSTVDSEKVAARGIHAVQLKTGGFCHVDAVMVGQALESMDMDKLDLIIIENVGNLVCPAEFDTGAIKNAMILSVPEGDDKPLKYPLMFSICDALVINKIDYLTMSDFDIEMFKNRVRTLNSDISIFEVSCRTGQGIDPWAAWVEREIKTFAELS